MFRLLYLVIEEPAAWLAYVQFAFMASLMGITYLQVTRRRLSFMVMFVVMALIFFVDVFAYLAFLTYLVLRDHRAAPAK